MEVDNEVTEFVEDFRRPINDTESRLLLREVFVEGAATDVWRGTRDVEAAGEPCGWRTFGVAPSSLSITPNSLATKLVGEAFVDEATSTLVRLVANADDEFFRGGEGIADVRLDMRGIFVGVSLGSPEYEFNDDEGGSLLSFSVCELLVPVVPTDGEPAMVGN